MGIIQMTPQLRLVPTEDGEYGLHIGMQTSDGPECLLRGMKLQQFWRSMDGADGMWTDVPIELQKKGGE